MKPVHNFPPYLFKIHSNIILQLHLDLSNDIIPPSSPRSSKWSRSFRFSDQNVPPHIFLFHIPHSISTNVNTIVFIEFQGQGNIVPLPKHHAVKVYGEAEVTLHV